MPVGVPRNARNGMRKSLCSPTTISYIAKLFGDYRFCPPPVIGLRLLSVSCRDAFVGPTRARVRADLFIVLSS